MERVVALVCILALSAAQPVFAEERAPASITEAEPALRTEPHQEEAKPTLLGDWGGLKTSLQERGFDLGLVYKIETVRNIRGGLKTGTHVLGNVDVTLETDLGKVLGAKNFTLFLYGLGDHGSDPTESAGDNFATSNIQSPDTFKLYEAYLRYGEDERYAALIGFRDLNADFYVTESSKTLLNSAFGISPSLAQSGANGPSIFPTTSLALTAHYKTASSFYIQGGAFNAVSGDPNNKFGTQLKTSFDKGYLLIGEGGISGEINEAPLKVGIGVWRYTQEVSSIDTAREMAINSGSYLLADLPVSHDLSFFGRFGLAASQVNKFSSAIEYGVQWRGLGGLRHDDALAIGIASGTASADHQLANDSEYVETAVEASYKMSVGNGVFLTPDYQYVINPGLSQTVEDAQVVGLRAEINF